MNILSLNGGGTSGYMTILLLAKLEKEYANKHKCFEMFDMIAGVSTGSIIGALLAKGLCAQEVVEIYKEFIPEVFGRKNWMLLTKPLYSRKSLEKLMQLHLNVEMKDCKTRFMTHAVSLGKPQLEVDVWKSWKEKWEKTKLYDVCLASSAAPVYFEPYTFNGKTYIDGSFATNNPSMNAIAEALRLNVPLENIYNVNIVCSEEHGYNDPEKLKTVFSWLPKIAGVFSYSCSDAVHYQAHSLLGFNNHFIQPDVSLPLDSKDLGQMEAVADVLWNEHGETICKNVFF
jgi:patatin-like phospholipase/acyl hydrolase